MAAQNPAWLRIGDAERDATVEQLAQHFAAGRLTRREHEERTTLALTARTQADLDTLLADLPAVGEQRSRPRRTFPAVDRVAGVLLAAVLFVAALQVVPVLAAAVLFVVVSRGVFGRRCGWGHSQWHHRRW